MKTDFPHILCINPWIHDFAAFDFWAKPLGLLSIAAVLREQGMGVSFIDCLDRFHPQAPGVPKILWDGRGPYHKTPIRQPSGLDDTARTFYRYGIKPEWFAADLNAVKTPDLILVTSLMTYWASGVAETIEHVKQVFPDVPVVLGGIYASLCFDHATATTRADHVVKGPAEPCLKEIVRQFTGFVMDDRHRSGCLDDLPWPALDLCRNITYAPILTSRGCPFSCDYCASSFLEPGLRQRSPQRVFEEIAHWHHQHRITHMAFYDDALLVNADRHAFPLLEKIIASKMDLSFHTPNALHVREISQQAAQLMFRAGFKTLRLGLETADFSPNRSHDHKVGNGEFLRAVSHLTAAGFAPDQIGAYLLCGLPGQRLDEVTASVAFVRQAGITPVLAYYTPIPHTRLWENALAHSRYDLLAHPVFTNNTLFPCVTSDRDLARIFQLKKNLLEQNRSH